MHTACPTPKYHTFHRSCTTLNKEYVTFWVRPEHMQRILKASLVYMLRDETIILQSFRHGPVGRHGPHSCFIRSFVLFGRLGNPDGDFCQMRWRSNGVCDVRAYIIDVTRTDTHAYGQQKAGRRRPKRIGISIFAICPTSRAGWSS